jgi:serine kinase of HPr protein (carbohydrate metabolism regulator)
MTSPLHATAVALYGPSGWRAVLLAGPSGSGKSDLALRLIGRAPVGGGWRLVADDYCEIWASGGSVWAAAPEPIAGRMEARGVGIIPSPQRPIARVALVVRCGHERVERLPLPESESLCGLPLPCIALDTRAASAPDTLEVALKATLSGLDVAPL